MSDKPALRRNRCAAGVRARGLRPEGPALSTRRAERGGDAAAADAAAVGEHRGAELAADRRIRTGTAIARSGSDRARGTPPADIDDKKDKKRRRRRRNSA